MPVAYFEVIGRDSAKARVPILIAVDHLHRAIHIGGHAGYLRNTRLDCRGVINRKGLRCSVAGSYPIHIPPARFDPDHIDAKGRQLILHLSCCPLAYGNRADHCRDGDHDAEHGQRRAELISFQGALRHAQRIPIDSPIGLGSHWNMPPRSRILPRLVQGYLRRRLTATGVVQSV